MLQQLLLEQVIFQKIHLLVYYNMNTIDFDFDYTTPEQSQKLIDLGYTNVYNLDGGLINWGAELE